jgi:molybdopterin synthase sulfur carrier subunit
MQVQVLIFGPLKDVTGVEKCTLKDVADTNAMVNEMNSRFPGFSKMEYLIAVEKEIVHENTLLSENNTVALLPPYSGG